MAEIDAALDSPPEQPEQEAYLAACSALLLAIATIDGKMTGEESVALIAAMPTPGMRLNLAFGLDVYGLIETTDDQVTR